MEENKVVEEFVPSVGDDLTICDDELSAFEGAVSIIERGNAGDAVYSSECLTCGAGDYTKLTRISVCGKEYKFVGLNDLNGKRHFYLYDAE